LEEAEAADVEAPMLEFSLAEAVLVPDKEAGFEADAAEVEAPTLEFSLAEAELVPDEEAESEEPEVALPEDVSCAEDVPFSDGVGVALEPSLNEVDTTPDTDSELEELAISLSGPVVVS
jgi:hypothetical protein